MLNTTKKKKYEPYTNTEINNRPILKFCSFREYHIGSAFCISRPVQTHGTPRRKERCDGDWNKWKIKGLKGEKWKEITEESFNIRRFPEPLRHYFNIPLLLMINLRSSFTALLKFYYFAMYTFAYLNYDYIRFFFLLYHIHFHSLTQSIIQTSISFNYFTVRSCQSVIP